ncbi:MAG: efflux RND transporter periplasmic adaptor subunit [Verrucomicrobia bacterium]|nr:efflux RND transporter periplasmic adaptor subunit [Verrucomicrobiota bacterium]
MNAKTLLLLLLVAALSASVTWYLTKHWPAASGARSASSNTRKVLYYQSSMHPWIKSDQPGKCTICGMDLVPVYEGDTGFDAAAGLVTLSSNTINVINVQTTEVRRQPLRRSLRVAGMIDDDDTRHRRLSAYVEGRIEKLFVNYVGAEVVEGQPLATLYSPQLLTAEREYVALVRLLQSTSASARTPEQQRLIDAAAQRLLRLGLNAAQIDALPAKSENDRWTEILAPMTGTVVTRGVYEGQYVKEGEMLFEIGDFAKMWFLFDAYERDLAWIKPGQTVAVTTPSVPGKVFEAPIVFIDPNLRDATRSAKVRVEIPNPLIEERGHKRREVLHKLYAEGVVQVEIPEVLALPRSAVLSPGAQPVVYLDRGGGSFEQRKVRLGRSGDDLWEVLDGVDEGERVVTTGNLLIDAQATLNQSVSQGEAPTGHDHSTPAGTPKPDVEAKPVPLTSKPLSESQRQAAQEFLAVADALASALARDNLADFNKETGKLHTLAPNLAKAFDDAATRPLLAKIEATGHLTQAADLTAVRQAFLPFSGAVVDFTKQLRAAEGDFASVKVFQCPMADRAFPGAPKIAFWIQLQPPLRNPYFGADMLDCGTEVKP